MRKRIEFCDNVGITLDDYYVKQCGDFEIEDMVRAYENGKTFFDDCLETQFTEKDKQIEELKSRNAELKCECRRCVYTDSPCILSDYGKDRNGICDHFKDVFDEITELKTNFKIAKDNEYEYSSLLTKAKEIISGLLSSCFGYNSKTVNYEVKAKAEQFLYAKTIIQDLLDNSDEYARERAINFLKEIK